MLYSAVETLAGTNTVVGAMLLMTIDPDVDMEDIAEVLDRALARVARVARRRGFMSIVACG